MGKPVCASLPFPTWSPACALPRTPCSGPNNATNLTFLAACRMSTVERSASSTPVGLVTNPTRFPSKILKFCCFKTSKPVFTFAFKKPVKQRPIARKKTNFFI